MDGGAQILVSIESVIMLAEEFENPKLLEAAKHARLLVLKEMAPEIDALFSELFGTRTQVAGCS